jgi:hypothetical protein
MARIRHLAIIITLALLFCGGCIREASQEEVCPEREMPQLVCYGASGEWCCPVSCGPGCSGGGCGWDDGYCEACFCPE